MIPGYDIIPEGTEYKEMYVFVHSNEIAGILIGREGRNVRMFEEISRTRVEFEGKDLVWAKISGEAYDVDVAAKALWEIVHADKVCREEIQRIYGEVREDWRKWYIASWD